MVREALSQPGESWSEDDWQDARSEVRDLTEGLFGPVLGNFTLKRAATTGDHPEEVRKAWIGVPLLVRDAFAARMHETVQVLCSDAFNALVESGTSENILQYWIDMLDGRARPEATFGFAPTDGSYSPIE